VLPAALRQALFRTTPPPLGVGFQTLLICAQLGSYLLDKGGDIESDEKREKMSHMASRSSHWGKAVVEFSMNAREEITSQISGI
jgi:hypothetical protein